MADQQTTTWLAIVSKYTGFEYLYMKTGPETVALYHKRPQSYDMIVDLTKDVPVTSNVFDLIEWDILEYDVIYFIDPSFCPGGLRAELPIYAFNPLACKYSEFDDTIIGDGWKVDVKDCRMTFDTFTDCYVHLTESVFNVQVELKRYDRKQMAEMSMMVADSNKFIYSEFGPKGWGCFMMFSGVVPNKIMIIPPPILDARNLNTDAISVSANPNTLAYSFGNDNLMAFGTEEVFYHRSLKPVYNRDDLVFVDRFTAFNDETILLLGDGRHGVIDGVLEETFRKVLSFSVD